MSDRTTDRAMILARGLGTRMRRSDPAAAALDPQAARVADTGMKAMIPIGRPFLDYLLSALAEAGYRRVCLVIGPEHDKLRQYYTQEIETPRLQIGFAVQAEPLGTANAVLAGESWAGGEPFVMLNSDNYYPSAALAALADLPAPGVALFNRQAMLAGSNIPPERIRSFAAAELTADRRCLARVIEKPDEPTIERLARQNDGRLLLSMNCWLFDRSIFEDCRAIPRSARGEYEIPDAVSRGIARGLHYSVAAIDAPVLDLSSRSDIAPVKARLAGVEVKL